MSVRVSGKGGVFTVVFRKRTSILGMCSNTVQPLLKKDTPEIRTPLY